MFSNLYSTALLLTLLFRTFIAQTLGPSYPLPYPYSHRAGDGGVNPHRPRTLGGEGAGFSNTDASVLLTLGSGSEVMTEDRFEVGESGRGEGGGFGDLFRVLVLCATG